MGTRSKQKQSSAQSADALRLNGLQAFKSGDYTRAIERWERAGRQVPAKLPTEALAEAYFRRGIQGFYRKSQSADVQAALKDLRRAIELDPGEARYHFHLGLAAHRQGDLESAIAAYRSAHQGTGEFASRAGYPLALALLQQGQDPTADAVWATLTPEERARLQDATAFRRRPYTLSAHAPAFWHGLVALDRGEFETARELLQQTLMAPGSPMEAALAHYYLGVLAAHAEDWPLAIEEWRTAAAAGVNTVHLQDNLAEALQRFAEDATQAGDINSALSAAEEAFQYRPTEKSLRELLSYLYQRRGYQAAQAGQWSVAQRDWEKATQMGEDSFRLAYNRALACERAEDFLAAAEAWREALRRRPRRADHPDAISDAQVARLWRRAAEAYVKAEEYDAALQVYRTAVKWDPDNLETRMMLVEGLFDDGRLWAAENELQRILEKNPDYIPALLKMAEAIVEGGYWWDIGLAEQYWLRALQVDPQNEIARSELVNYYVEQAQFRIGMQPEVAAELYDKALRLQPDNASVLASLGGAHLHLKHTAEGQAYMKRALERAGDNEETLAFICEIQLAEVSEAQFWSTLEEIERSRPSISSGFYIQLAQRLILIGKSALLQKVIERVTFKAPSKMPLNLTIGNLLLNSPAYTEAQVYLERALSAGEPAAEAHLGLMLLALHQGKTTEARKHWREADKIARREQDPDLLGKLARARELLDIPPALLNMLLTMPFPGADSFFPSDFPPDEDFDEDFGGDF